MDDIFIPPHELNNAMHGDIVLVRVSSQVIRLKDGKAPLLKLLNAVSKICWYIYRNKNFGFVIPDDKKMANDIFIPKEATNGAVEGHKVVVKITSYPEGRISRRR